MVVLQNIFGDEKWSSRQYKNGQETFVVLYLGDDLCDNIVTSEPTKLQNEKTFPQMIICWNKETLTDNNKHSVSCGFITIRFQIDQAYFAN